MLRPTSTFAIAAAALLGLSSVAEAQLLHRYSFNDTGTTIVDSVGGADGMLVGGAVLTGSEVLLDGIDGHVELPGGLASASEQRTFEIWFNWTGVSNWERLLDVGDSVNGQGITYFVMTPQGSNPAAAGAIKTMTTGLSEKVYAGSTTANGVLTHLCVTVDSTNDLMSLYLDGTFQDTVSITENLSEINDLTCYLGRSLWDQDPYYNGSISEFRIYDGILSVSEIDASFANGPDGFSLGVNYCGPAVANSTGVPATMSAGGSAIVANNDLIIQTNDLPTFSFGFFITSTAQGFVTNPGGSTGNLCLSGGIGRYVGPGQIQNSGSNGSTQLALDLTQTPTPLGLVSVSPGETWNFQAWYRDAINGTPTSNFTDGLEITFQ